MVPLVVVALAVAAVVVFWPSAPVKRLTAYFTNTVGLYEGADVTILGIPVGEVDKITPAGQAVKVELHYEAKYKIPADAQAVIVAQSLVSDRFVQLTPVFTSGAVLQDKATLDVARTAVPVEVDEVANSLNELSKALGPEGANADGSLSKMLEVAARNFDGNGEEIRGTIKDSAEVLSTLSDNSDNITASIENLESVTQALADNDTTVRQFTDHLGEVSAQLNGEKEELDQVLKILGPTLRNVTSFVKDNRKSLSKNVNDLAEITAILVKQQDALDEFTRTAPVAISNMTRAYDPISGTLHTRANFRQFKNPADWICSLAYSLGTPANECLQTLKPISGGLGVDLHLDISWITALTTTYNPEPLPPDAYGPNKPKKGAKKSAKKTTSNNSGPADKTLGGLLLGGTS
ncbi:MCE family protein [Actinocorallia sp. B10E7]|uniref:MCE family protein n=1 Tax=Actinocorallia sp. B10E7 TaxID=3153558 RepID=UPI00325C81AA